jgi:colicin import membrane protein
VNKSLGIILGLSLLVGCSSEASEPVEKEVKEEEHTLPTQEELNDQLKEDAKQAAFAKLNSRESTGEKVFTEGEVTNIAKEGMLGEFTLTTSDGMFTIGNMLGTEISEGDNVKVYGVTNGKDATGFPVIDATIIEQSK